MVTTTESGGSPIFMGGGDGFGGGMGIWGFLIIALFLMGNGGWGGNNFANAIGYNNLATQNDVQRGFDTLSLENQSRDILGAVSNGTAQAVAASNQVYHDIERTVQDKYSELQRDIAEARVAQTQAMANQNECCCNTLRALDGVNYNNAINTAAINANTTAQTQKILDAMAQSKIDAMQNRINQLELQNSMAGVVRYPNGMTYNAGASPFCNGGCPCCA